MERQLVGLSNLVHSALITRELNPTVREEMIKLQQQINDLQTPTINNLSQIQKSSIAVKEAIKDNLIFCKENNNIKKQNDDNNKNLPLTNNIEKTIQVNFFLINIITKNLLFFFFLV